MGTHVHVNVQLYFIIQVFVLFILSLQMSYLSKSDGIEVVSMLGRCLPHIVPNVLLGKREVMLFNTHEV